MVHPAFGLVQVNQRGPTLPPRLDGDPLIEGVSSSQGTNGFRTCTNSYSTHTGPVFFPMKPGPFWLALGLLTRVLPTPNVRKENTPCVTY